MEEKIALFPGSFDPFTKGHEDIVLRGLKLFDKIYVAIGHNTQKSRYFEVGKILGHIDDTFANYPQIEAIKYQELTAEVARRYGAKYILRGLRNTTDFEYENTIGQLNKHLYNEVETIFLITSPDYAYISSTMIREVHRYKGNVDPYLPYKI